MEPTKEQLSNCAEISKHLTTRQGYEFWAAIQDTASKVRKAVRIRGLDRSIEDIPDEVFALYIHNCALDATKEGRKLGPRCSPPEGLEAKMLLNKVAEGNFSRLLKVFLKPKKKRKRM